jgi:hypothetical protein
MHQDRDLLFRHHQIRCPHNPPSLSPEDEREVFIVQEQNLVCKTDCCPFDVASTVLNYLVPQNTGQGTPLHCPDYSQSVSSSCCPS